jgi:chromosome segregation ATPase
MIDSRAFRTLPALFLCACASSSKAAKVVPAAPRAETSASEAAVLYARDGSVVSGAGPESAAPNHGAEPRGESRMQMLDLYQRVASEKDALAKELRELDRALAESRAAQDALTRERDEQRARTAALEAELAKSDEDKNELAARLTTAQIRRLEAEKLLLETRLALARGGERDGVRATQASAASSREGASSSKAERSTIDPSTKPASNSLDPQPRRDAPARETATGAAGAGDHP